MTAQASCLSTRLYINGITMQRPSTGAVKHSRHKRLINAATKYAGKCLCDIQHEIHTRAAAYFVSISKLYEEINNCKQFR